MAGIIVYLEQTVQTYCNKVGFLQTMKNFEKHFKTKKFHNFFMKSYQVNLDNKNRSQDERALVQNEPTQSQWVLKALDSQQGDGIHFLKNIKYVKNFINCKPGADKIIEQQNQFDKIKQRMLQQKIINMLRYCIYAGLNNLKRRDNCFDILGCDILFDEELNPIIEEFNQNPNLNFYDSNSHQKRIKNMMFQILQLSIQMARDGKSEKEKKILEKQYDIKQFTCLINELLGDLSEDKQLYIINSVNNFKGYSQQQVEKELKNIKEEEIRKREYNAQLIYKKLQKQQEQTEQEKFEEKQRLKLAKQQQYQKQLEIKQLLEKQRKQEIQRKREQKEIERKMRQQEFQKQKNEQIQNSLNKSEQELDINEDNLQENKEGEKIEEQIEQIQEVDENNQNCKQNSDSEKDQNESHYQNDQSQNLLNKQVDSDNNILKQEDENKNSIKKNPQKKQIKTKQKTDEQLEAEKRQNEEKLQQFIALYQNQNPESKKIFHSALKPIQIQELKSKLKKALTNKNKRDRLRLYFNSITEKKKSELEKKLHEKKQHLIQHLLKLLEIGK
ncbi:hypothetical protein PPERSA_05609 [Pseudocohnilembus persalinus]|uniref:Tubulin-tyrosine ligase/Tubulin polyglutamylase n=1 Tax=Pseudocohnilembus persalinus TaxID=266149 RepID=A0A0V0QG61_PSEPJ|nr:hypothetical protein PPERSA_05609 [Pseudocohnilembus persalinus]|eukprot:KRX01209.1 hypothetical protein PPERSA_05609 [Pseudocohnilembus persalinus]